MASGGEAIAISMCAANQPAGLFSPEVFAAVVLLLGLPVAFGFAGVVSLGLASLGLTSFGLASRGLAAASGLALACRAAGLAPGFASLLASPALASASGLAAWCARLPCFGVAWLAESAATAATNAAPVRVGPV